MASPSAPHLQFRATKLKTTQTLTVNLNWKFLWRSTGNGIWDLLHLSKEVSASRHNINKTFTDPAWGATQDFDWEPPYHTRTNLHLRCQTYTLVELETTVIIFKTCHPPQAGTPFELQCFSKSSRENKKIQLHETRGKKTAKKNKKNETLLGCHSQKEHDFVYWNQKDGGNNNTWK